MKEEREEICETGETPCQPAFPVPHRPLGPMGLSGKAMTEDNVQTTTDSTPPLRFAPGAVINLFETILVGVVFFLLAERFLAFISQYAVNIFFSDQWDFDNATLFEHHSLWQMFTWQHGPHRQGVGALLGWLVEPVFHWNSRTESFFVGGIIVVATVCAMWLKRRLYGRFSYSDVIIPIIFLTPLQYETLFVTANLAHGPLPLLFIVLYCLAWTCQPVLLRYSLVLTINFLAIYTGFGLFLGLLTPLLLAVDYWANLRNTEKGRLCLWISLILSLASFGSFFIGYRVEPAVDCFTFQLQSLSGYAWFVAVMFAPFFGVNGIQALPTAVGAAAVCTLLAALAAGVWGLLRTRGTRWPRYAATTILTAFCLLFCLGTTYGRLCMGIESAMASRYVIYLNLGLLGIYFSLLTISNSILRHFLGVIFGLSLLGGIQLQPQTLTEIVIEHNLKESWRKCYFATGSVAQCNQYAKVYPWDPERTQLQEKLDYLKKTRQNLFADSK
jgi:hypothetical protein